MKKQLILTILLLTGFSAFAFDFSFGVKGGVGFNYSTGSDSTRPITLGSADIPSELGLNAATFQNGQLFSIRGSFGGFIEFGFTNFFSIAPEVFWGLKNGHTIGVKGSQRVIFEYESLDADVLLKGRIPTAFGRVTLGVGPSFSFGLKKVSIKETSHDTKIEKNFRDLYADPQIGIIGELGLEADAGPGFFLFALRTQWTFTKAAPNANFSSHVPLTFMTGYAFKFF